MEQIHMPLKNLRVAILSTNDFEQAELAEPRKALIEAGATIKIISPQPDKIQGMNHDVKADFFPVDMTLEEADPDMFDAVLLPGGALNADKLRMDANAQMFITTINQEKKPIAFICHAPWLLVSSGLVKNRELTSYYTIQDDIKNAGGIWLDQEVVRDHNWVSSRQPSDIPAFNREMISLFSEYNHILNGDIPYDNESEFGANNAHAAPTNQIYGSVGGESHAEKNDEESKWINGEAEDASPA